MNFVVIALLAFILIRELFFMHSLNKLLNKFMSRNYYDFKIAEEVPKSNAKTPEARQEFNELPESIGILQEF